MKADNMDRARKNEQNHFKMRERAYAQGTDPRNDPKKRFICADNMFWSLTNVTSKNGASWNKFWYVYGRVAVGTVCRFWTRSSARYIECSHAEGSEIKGEHFRKLISITVHTGRQWARKRRIAPRCRFRFRLKSDVGSCCDVWAGFLFWFSLSAVPDCFSCTTKPGELPNWTVKGCGTYAYLRR